MMSEFRAAAAREIAVSEKREQENLLYVDIQNLFGEYAEDKVRH